MRPDVRVTGPGLGPPARAPHARSDVVRRLASSGPTTGPGRVSGPRDVLAALSRPGPVALLLAGLVTSAALPLLEALLGAVGDLSPGSSARAARLVLHGVLGAAVMAGLLHPAEAQAPGRSRGIRTSAHAPGELAPDAPGGRALGPRELSGPALGLMAGLLVGSLLSPAGPDGLRTSTPEAATAGLTALLLGAATVAASDVAGRRRDPRGALRGSVVVAGALLAALIADATTAASAIVDGGTGRGLVERAVPVLQADWSPGAVVAAVAVLAAAVLGRQAAGVIAEGAGLGLLAAAAAVALRLRAGPLETDPGAGAYLTWTVWLVVGVAAIGAGAVAARRDAAAGALVSSAAALTAAWLLVLTGSTLGGMLRLDHLLGLVAPLTLAAALPAAALGALLRSTGQHLPRATHVAAGALAAGALAGAALIVGPAAVNAADRVEPMRTYLSEHLPLLRLLRDDALLSGRLAEMAPEVSLAADIRAVVLPLYDHALDGAAEVTQEPLVRDDPEVGALHAAYVAVVTAERAAFLAEAEAYEVPSALRQQRRTAAVLAAHEAMAWWAQLAAAAQEAYGPSS